MINAFRKLMREQLQETTSKFLELTKKPIPKKGWIRTIRESLGLSSYALSQRVGCSQSNIIAMEQSEQKGTINLKTLEQAAAAMNCKLVYCLVPLKPLDEILEDQARAIAQKQIKVINHSMGLEQQGLNQRQLKQQEDALVEELLQGNPRNLWNKGHV